MNSHDTIYECKRETGRKIKDENRHGITTSENVTGGTSANLSKCLVIFCCDDRGRSPSYCRCIFGISLRIFILQGWHANTKSGFNDIYQFVYTETMPIIK